jgi:hypothetical protein
VNKYIFNVNWTATIRGSHQMELIAEDEEEARDKLEDDYGINYSDYTKIIDNDCEIYLHSVEEIKETQ